MNDGDRVAQAWQWLTTELQGGQVPPVLAFLGLGEGHVLDALQRHAPTTRVLALEPDAASAQAFLATRTWHTWRQGDRLAYLVGPDYAGADDAWRVFTGAPGSPPVLLHPGLAITPGVGQAAQVLKKILVGVAANEEARRKFAPRYLVNSIRNVPAIVAGSDIRHLTDAYRGTPAVIAAAGPSLDEALAPLGEARDRGLLIACDTALRPLLAAGLAPQLAVGVDPSELNARHLLSLPECADTWLVAESALDRNAAAPFDGRTFWFHVSNHEPWPWLNEHGLDVGRIDVWGSVLTAAFQVACLAGCDPIVIVGADMAFTGGRPYARGTTYEIDWASGTAVGHSLEDVWRQQIATRKTRAAVADLHGRETTTTPALTSFRDWLVARAARSGRRVINASGAGIFAGAGVEQAALADVLTKTVAVPPVAACARRHAGVRPTRLASRLREAHALVAGGRSAHPLHARWKQFSGDGFDAGAVAASLDEAARALETKRRRPAPPALVDWARIAGLPAARVLPTHLPEALARFAAAMSGARVLPSLAGCDGLTDGDRTAMLHEALDLLARIRDEIGRLDGLPTVKARGDVEPIGSVAYAWPERIRWAVETFEALLGVAWVSGATGLQSAFFAGPVTPRDCGDGRDPGATGIEPSQASHAYARLVREWLECWASLDTSTHVHDMLARLIGVASATGAVAASGCDAGPADLALSVRTGDRTVSFVLPCLVDESALGRVLTGLVHPGSDTHRFDLPRIEAPTVTAAITSRRIDGRSGERPRRAWPATLSHPRLFPDHRVRRSSIAYAIDHGVVCVRPNDTQSHVVGDDGRVEPHHRWPRPIVSELPFGEGGAIAWASGRALSPRGAPYVMYRRTAGEAPVVVDLPFNPIWGAWWNARVYWGFVSSDLQPARGLGSWAPGDDARVDLVADLALFDVCPVEAGLRLEPATRLADYTYVRRLLTHGWTWHPVHGLEPRPLGPHGAAGSRVVGHGWTTTTFPEADRVMFERADGACLSMTVHHPFRAAWLGRSLLVNTVDQQLLLFEGVLDDLAACRDETCAQARNPAGVAMK